MGNSFREKELFENSPVLEAILKLAIPTVIGQIILVIYNIADTFYIGLTGSDAMITAVTVCMPAFMFLSAISNLFGVGGASVISRALGRRDARSAHQASGFAFWGCIGLTVLYSAGAWIFRNTFVNLLGGSAEAVHDEACRYLLITVVLGGLFTAMNTLMAHLIRAEGRSMQASIGVALGGVCNIVLDPLFMFVILPRGNEVEGAAIATALSNVIATLYFAAVFYKYRHASQLTLRLREGMPSAVVKDVLATGLPACLMTLFENISYAVLDNLMSAYGMTQQAGLGVAKKVNMLAHSIVRGMSQGVLPLIGYNYAANNHKRMKSSILVSAALSILAASACMTVNLIFSRQLIGLFIQSGSESLVYGARFLKIMSIGCPFSACAYAFISFFQAVGKGLRSFVLAMLRKGIVDMPLMFLLNTRYPETGIVSATPVADIICCVVSIYMFADFIKLNRVFSENLTEGESEEARVRQERASVSVSEI